VLTGRGVVLVGAVSGVGAGTYADNWGKDTYGVVGKSGCDSELVKIGYCSTVCSFRIWGHIQSPGVNICYRGDIIPEPMRGGQDCNRRLFLLATAKLSVPTCHKTH